VIFRRMYNGFVIFIFGEDDALKAFLAFQEQGPRWAQERPKSTQEQPKSGQEQPKRGPEWAGLRWACWARLGWAGWVEAGLG